MNNRLSNLWENRLSQFESSGKSITTWCKEQTIMLHQFYYWRRKLRNNQIVKSTSVQWLHLDGKPTDMITIQFGRLAIEVHKGFDPQLLREIVQVLQTV